MNKFSPPADDLEVSCVRGHFFDSGAFSQWTLAQKLYKENPSLGRWAFYHTPDFWDYMRGYAQFVRDHAVAIDYYANVDAIPHPEITWRNQQWLEGVKIEGCPKPPKPGLKPVPVVHYKTDRKWLRHYIDRGYKYIALGGLVGSLNQDQCQNWVDECFNIICDTPDRLPRVRVHGFGVTSFRLLWRYPWYSTDSTSWTVAGAYGGIYVPTMRDGVPQLLTPPTQVTVSDESGSRKKLGRHFLTLTPGIREQVAAWLKIINIPLDWDEKTKQVTEDNGVIKNHVERRAANLQYFERMRKAIPKYPWPWEHGRPSFGLQCPVGRRMEGYTQPKVHRGSKK